MAAPAESPALPPDEVHLWLVRPESVSAEVLRAAEALLDPGERARLHRFRLPALRLQHVVTRALVRTTLSAYAPVEPRQWRFAAGDHGRPFIEGPAGAPSLRFNLSHTRGLVACLVGGDREVGVDVEDAGRAMDALRLAGRFFSADEAAALRALPAAARPHRFFSYWTLKEAYIKARGLGLALPLGQFTFLLEEEGVRVRFAPELGDVAGDWYFAQFRPGDPHLGAVAVRHQGRPVRLVLRFTDLAPLA